MFEVGDIVEIFSPIASKKKYHLCVCGLSEVGIRQFFFLNSGDGYEAEFILEDGAIEGLPISPTGKTVISCSLIVKYNQRQLSLYKARKLSTLDKTIAADLRDFVAKSPALTRKETTRVTEALSAYVERTD